EFSGASFNTVLPLNPWADSWNGTYLSRVVIPVNTSNRSNIRIRFKLLQVAGSNAADKRISLLRVVANGRQVGPTLQPLTAPPANNPFQTIDFALDTTYIPGDPLIIELQSKCRYRFLPAATGGTDRNGNFIDDIVIYNSVANGAEVMDVTYDPPFPTATTPVTARARIRNNTNPNYNLISTTLDLKLNGALVQSVTTPLTLPFMQDTLYTFTNLFNIGLGSNDLCVVSSMPNGQADAFPLDDTLCIEAVGFPLVDNFPYCNNFDEGQPAWLTRNPVTLRNSGNSWNFGTPAKGLINGAASGPNAWYIGADSTYKPYDSSALYTPIFKTTKDSCYRVKFVTRFMTDFWANDTSNAPLHGDGGTLEYSTDGGTRWNTFGYLDTLTNEWYNAIIQSLAVFNSSQNIVGFGWSGVSPQAYVPMMQIFNTTDNAEVIFRFRFASDYAFQGEGWAIDDFCFELLPGPCEVVSVTDLKDQGLVLSQNFPNPASDQTGIAYYLPRGGRASLELRDMYGRPVWSRTLGMLEGGWYQERLETSALAQGLYYYSLNFEGRKLTRKMLITR
ncbi:MAG: T9SS type A sorting domain-containing protein, partial [Bacteroidia bacterium]